MPKTAPVHIKSIINNMLSGGGLSLSEEQNKVLDAWGKTVDKKILTHTKLKSLKKDKLVIGVDSSGWLYQLNLEKEKISKKLNQRLKSKMPLKIYFRLGEI